MAHLKIKNKPVYQHGELWVYMLRLIGGDPPDAYISSITCGEHFGRYWALASAMRMAENGSEEIEYATNCVASSIFFLNKSDAKGLKFYGETINKIEKRHLEKRCGGELITLEKDGEIRLIRDGKAYRVKADPDFDNEQLDVRYIPLTTKPHT